MLIIRYFRTGKRNQPFFKLVVIDRKKAPRGGRFVEELGFVNPLTKETSIDAERAKHWISQGAQPTITVHNLFVSKGIIEGKKTPAHKLRKGAKAAAPAEKAPAEAKEEKKEGAEAKPASGESSASQAGEATKN